jgi:hypothetical protein
VRAHFAAGTCVVHFTGSWLHVFLPPTDAADHALLTEGVAYGVHRLQEQGIHSFTTLTPIDLADVVRSVPSVYPSESHFDFHQWMPLTEVSGCGATWQAEDE